MIRVALVGAGVMGVVHGRSVGSFGDLAAVTHVVDPDPLAAEAAAKEFGSVVTGSLEEAVCSPDVDSVVVAVPPRFHRAIAELALEHGKSVFLEKPIALDLDDATAIVAAVERTLGRLMIGHVLRFMPGYPEVHALATGGSLGRPLSVVCRRVQAPPARTGWLADVDATGGIAPLVLVHDFDLMNWVLGTPMSVSSWVLQGAGVDASHVVAGVTYGAGTGVAEGSVAMPRTHPFSTSISVYCERGSVHYGYDVAPAADGARRDASQFAPASPPVVEVFPDDGAPAWTLPVHCDNPWLPEMEHFLQQVAADAPIENGTPGQALAALRVALAARESFTTGLPVAL